MPLLSLPLEVFERIAANLQIEDLDTLRRVSREASTKVKRTWSDAHIRQHCVNLEFPVASRTNKIPQDPDYRTAISRFKMKIPAAYNTVYDKSSTIGGDADLPRLHEDNEELQEIVDLFNTLKHVPQMPEVHIDMGYIAGMYEPDEADPFQIDLVFRALLVSGLQVDHLKLSSAWRLPFTNRRDDQSLSAAWGTACSKLETLTLSAWWIDDMGRDKYELANVLMELPELRVLEVQNLKRPKIKIQEHGQMAAALLRGSFHNLERLSLERQFVNLRDMTDFARREAPRGGLKRFHGKGLTIMGVGADRYERLDDDELEEFFIAEMARFGGVAVQLDGVTRFAPLRRSKYG